MKIPINKAKEAYKERMTDAEIIEFLDYFDGRLPDPSNYPKCFAYYIQLYRHVKRRN